MATTKDQIKAGVDFARKRNLRLVIRNTGHDFMYVVAIERVAQCLYDCRGRSTGYGALIINTHSFKEVSFAKKYTGVGNWTGSAATVGAGVQGLELYRQAFAQDPKVVVVGGECPVSMAGLEDVIQLMCRRRSDGLADTFRVVDMVRSRASTAWVPITSFLLTRLRPRAST